MIFKFYAIKIAFTYSSRTVNSVILPHLFQQYQFISYYNVCALCENDFIN